MDNIGMLMGFSLTRQEATIYLELLKGGQMTGYEVSKRTGISRSNVYTALAGLVEKGASDMMGSEPTYYIPVPVKSFCESKLRRLELYKADLIKSAEKAPTEIADFATVRGEENVVNRLLNMITDAQFRIYVSAGWPIMQQLRSDLFECIKNGLRVVAITTPPFELYGAQVYLTDKPTTQIRMIVDNTVAVSGEFTGDNESCSCIYSGSDYLKELVKDALKNEIRTVTAAKAR